jgi:hypothetical protein
MQAIANHERRTEAAKSVASILGDWYAQQNVTVSGVIESSDGQLSKVDVTGTGGVHLFHLIVESRVRLPDVIRFTLVTDHGMFYSDVLDCYWTALQSVFTKAMKNGCTLVPMFLEQA